MQLIYNNFYEIFVLGLYDYYHNLEFGTLKHMDDFLHLGRFSNLADMVLVFVSRAWRSSLFSNAFYLMLNTVTTSLLGFVFWNIMARFPSGRGRYTFGPYRRLEID